jgi:hypothetical protein
MLSQAEYDKLKDDLIPDLCDTLSRHSEVKFTASGNLYLNSEKTDHKSASSVFLRTFSQEPFRKYMPLLAEAPSPNYFFEAFRVHLRTYLNKNKYSAYSVMAEVENFTYDGFIPFISIYDSAQVLFFHSKTNRIAELDWKTYTLTTDKERQLTPVRAVIEFNPYRPEQIYKQDSGYGQTCTHINTYKKPEWQVARELTDAERQKYCNLPSIINDFFTHLFPDAGCREFVFDWLHFAITLRCETYLVLNGAKGIGKNILSETICKALIGKDNHKMAQPGALESQFNSVLVQSRMIVFDEFKIDDDEKVNRLKRYINAEQMIEKKGVDVGKTQVTYNSFIISNNGLHDILIYWDDRRFSVADMTETKLEEAWSSDQIKLLVDTVSDPESPVMREFGYWLLYRTPKVAKDNFHAFKGRHFYKLCYATMAEWQKLIIDEITSKSYDDMSEGDLRIKFKERTGGQGRLPQRTKIEDFLKNYKHEGKHYLGELRQEERTWQIIINDEFRRPASADTSGISWESLL